jgi:pre-rRNA-processing protein TSR2
MTRPRRQTATIRSTCIFPKLFRTDPLTSFSTNELAERFMHAFFLGIKTYIHFVPPPKPPQLENSILASATQISGSAMQASKGQGDAQLAPLPGIHFNPGLPRNFANYFAEKCQVQFELGVALTLSIWPALSLAVINNWGGVASSDKRDWFAGAIVELFSDRPDTDIEDVETVLLQVMLDEFEVNVDDESGYEVAEQIMRLRKSCGKGEFGEVEQLRSRWERRGGKGEVGVFKRVERGEEDDTDWDSDDLEETDGEDVEMWEAPPMREKEKVVPEVDEDGFTKVTKKR